MLYLRADGELVAGDAAERHAVTEPQRIARQFKRRLGDPTPLLVGDAALPAEVLTSRLLRWTVETVARHRGGERASTIVLTHPANWGPFKRELLDKASELAGVGRTILLTEPQAAAISYSSAARVDPGAVIAVYDLGGGTFDAAVLRKEGDGGFTMLGTPEGIEHLGGIDVDAAVFAHVTGALGEAYEELDPEDPAALAAVARLRLDCTQAKEALSLDTETTVPVLLPTIQTEVRVTRAELEAMIRPPLSETVTALERAVRSAGLTPEGIDHVLLVGGSSRIPLVAELVSAGLGRPVAVDAHPQARDRPGRRHRGRPGGGGAGARRHPPATAPRGHPPGPTRGGSRRRGRRPDRRRHGRTAAPGGRRAPRLPPGPAPAAPPQARPAPPGGGPAWAPEQRPAPPTAAALRSPAPPPAGGPYGGGQHNSGQQPLRGPHLRGGPVRATAALAGLPGGRDAAAPGSSGDLPPGYLTTDARATRKKKERRKRRLMISLGVVLVVAAVAATLIIQDLQSQPETVASLEVGECFTGEATDLSTVDCGQPHNGELYFLAAPPDPAGAYPGVEVLRNEVGQACITALADYFGAGAEVAAERGIEVQPLAPSEDQWDDGTTDVHCVAVPAEGGTGVRLDQGPGRRRARAPKNTEATS